MAEIAEDEPLHAAELEASLRAVGSDNLVQVRRLAAGVDKIAIEARHQM